MIAVATESGVLHVYAKVRIPSAEAGQWSPERHATLIELIRDYVEAAELVDGNESITPELKKSHDL